MSAFMVDKDHIDFLVQAAIAGASESRGWSREPFSYWDVERDVRVSIDPYADGARTEGQWSEKISPSELGQRLIDVNLASIHARYPDSVDYPDRTPGPRERYWETPYVFTPIDNGREVYSIGAGLRRAVAPIATTANIAHQLSHYEYQACEHDGWRTSQGASFCEAMRKELLATLPGGDKAPWGWSRVIDRGAA